MVKEKNNDFYSVSQICEKFGTKLSEEKLMRCVFEIESYQLFKVKSKYYT